ncbi:oligosaccharide flippase family protein [Haloferax volcanii]|uniref:Oligosaccharide flippase family protein n=2 Tax=Haloferax volcanii TaxID=2246 RepID=A0A6C0UTS5_HALVO|nr:MULTISPECIES: polysaccharide biosynthesis C-terminal domain-containing protein [Haloferax]ELZ93849.1 agl cluster protein AglR [Haloferax alexandrinus JCM 10717]NLV02422.1 oligosaccharide flippase family protein [Haloferax alexandrinus]QIB78590.1 oligosaccharide flippase family protein [Haloferax alexandrinus]TVT96032.1 oligosaccharide flippase family protein [Haloferax volcanii]
MAKLARASALQFGANVTQTFVGAIITIYVINELGVGAFGIFALSAALVKWASIPAVGIRGAVITRMNESDDISPSEYFTTASVLTGAIILVGLLALLGYSPFVEQYLDYNGTQLVGGMFVSNVSFRLVLGGLRGENRVEMSSLYEALWGILSSLVKLALVYTGVGVDALFYGEITSSIVIGIFGVYSLNISFVSPTRSAAISLYSWARYGWLDNLKRMSYSWLDTIILGFFVSTSLVGIYEVAWRISALFVLLPTAISKSTFPTISSLRDTDKLNKVRRILTRGLSVAGVLAIPGLVGSVLVGGDILALYGPSVSSVGVAVSVLVFLSVVRLVECYETLVMQALNALDLPDRTFRIGVIFITTNIILNVSLIPMFGVIGAAIATLLSMTLGSILAVRALPKAVQTLPPVSAIGSQFVSAGAMAVVLCTILNYRPIGQPIEVVLYVLAGATTYGFVLLSLSSNFRERVQQLLSESLG